MLTRSQFDGACQAFAAKHKSNASYSRALRDWTWIENYPYGYMARTQRYQRPNSLDLSGDPDPELDPATAAVPSPETEDVTSQQFVVFSPGFQVPAFYFTAYSTNGATLSLDQLMETTLFKFEVPQGSEATGFALTLRDAPFPLLSQGEHPTLGTPCWYLHPCETSKAVDELVEEVVQVDWSEQARLVRWLEMWLMTVGGVLDL